MCVKHKRIAKERFSELKINLNAFMIHGLKPLNHHAPLLFYWSVSPKLLHMLSYLEISRYSVNTAKLLEFRISTTALQFCALL